MCEAFGRDDRGDGNHRIVAQVKKKTREHRARPGARESKDDSDKSEQGHETPRPAKLRAVHQPEQDSSDRNPKESAEPDGAQRIDTGVLRDPGKLAGKERIKVAAENRFFY